MLLHLKKVVKDLFESQTTDSVGTVQFAMRFLLCYFLLQLLLLDAAVLTHNVKNLTYVYIGTCIVNV